MEIGKSEKLRRILLKEKKLKNDVSTARTTKFTNTNSYEMLDAVLLRAKSGDGYAEGELIAMLEPLVSKYCRRYFGYTNEDLMQQGRIRTLELIRRFDEKKKEVKFLGYMSKFLSCFYWDLKKSDIREREEYGFSLLGEEEAYEISYDEHGFLSVEVNDLLKPLNKEQRYILTRNVMYGATLGQVGEELRLSTEQVKYLKKKALGRLRGEKTYS